MIFYIAAPFKYREMAIKWFDMIETTDYVQSRWLITELDDSDYRQHFKREAIKDMGDIRRCDALILMSVDEPQRGGCLMEFMYAYANGIPCFTIGDRSWNQFLELATEHFDTIEDFLKWLDSGSV